MKNSNLLTTLGGGGHAVSFRTQVVVVALGQHRILTFLKNLYKIPPIEAFPARVDATCDLISVRRWWPFSLVCTGKASFCKIATHCRHLQTPKQKKMCNIILSALLSPSACGAGCWVEHGTYSVEPRKPSLFSSCKAPVWVQEVISLSISQPSVTSHLKTKLV